MPCGFDTSHHQSGTRCAWHDCLCAFTQHPCEMHHQVEGARPGDTITIRHAERCNMDGTIYTANLRSARATDAYTCHGRSTRESWRPQFTFHGFQCVELTG